MFPSEPQELQERLAKLATEALALESGPDAEALQEQQQQLAMRLHGLHNAWAHSDSNLMEIQHHQHHLNSAVAACLQHFYHLTLGPTHAAAVAASNDNDRVLHGMAPAAVQDNATPDSVVAILPAALPDDAHQPWGDITPSHLTSALTGLMLSLHDASAALTSAVKGCLPSVQVTAGQLQLTPVLQGWRSRLEAVRAVTVIMEKCLEAAEKQSLAAAAASQDEVPAVSMEVTTTTMREVATGPAVCTVASAVLPAVIACLHGIVDAIPSNIPPHDGGEAPGPSAQAHCSVAEAAGIDIPASEEELASSAGAGTSAASPESALPELVRFDDFEAASPGAEDLLEGELGGELEDDPDMMLQGQGLDEEWMEDGEDVDLSDLMTADISGVEQDLTLAPDTLAEAAALDAAAEEQEQEAGTEPSSKDRDAADSGGILVTTILPVLQGFLDRQVESSLAGAWKQATSIVQTLLQHCSRQQNMRLRHLAAFTWMHEHLITQVMPRKL